jgi:hypothetical protein
MIVTYDEICPISEKLLFSLYDAAKRGLPAPGFRRAAGKTIIGRTILLSPKPS